MTRLYRWHTGKLLESMVRFIAYLDKGLFSGRVRNKVINVLHTAKMAFILLFEAKEFIFHVS